MDRRRIGRLAQVLVASQMRSGRSTSTPGDFWGRPMSMLIVDAIIFLAVLGIGTQAIGAIGRADPGTLRTIAPQVLAFLPLLVMGAVVLAGLLFELSASAKFASSDAANWLPISSFEYVVASAISATFVYSISGAATLGIAVAVTWYTGDVALLALEGFLLLLVLFAGGLVVEMLRASTQRITAAVSRRTGRASLVLRIVAFVVVVLALQLAFNPLILYGLLTAVAGATGPLLAVPFLWPSRAVLAAAHGDLPGAVGFTGASVLLAAAFVGAAATIRSRAWAPVAEELELGGHAYAADHPVLSAFGLTSVEASLVSKDLRGLVRRRELLPVLGVPIVITLISFVSVLQGRESIGSSFSTWILSAYTPGLFALLLSATAIGQERRALQSLYSFPLRAENVFRAKAFSSLLPALAFSLALWIVVGVIFGSSVRVSVGLLGLMLTVATVAVLLGLSFAMRYSDFQERPRPQFLRPSAMIGTMLLGVVVIFAIALPVLFWLGSASNNPEALLPSALIAIVALALGYRFARSGAVRLMAACPL